MTEKTSAHARRRVASAKSGTLRALTLRMTTLSASAALLSPEDRVLVRALLVLAADDGTFHALRTHLGVSHAVDTTAKLEAALEMHVSTTTRREDLWTFLGEHRPWMTNRARRFPIDLVIDALEVGLLDRDEVLRALPRAAVLRALTQQQLRIVNACVDEHDCAADFVRVVARIGEIAQVIEKIVPATLWKSVIEPMLIDPHLDVTMPLPTVRRTLTSGYLAALA